MADLRFEDKNNQKKTSSVFASGAIALDDATDNILFTLPTASIVTAAYVVVTTADTTGTVDLKVGSTVIANEVDCSATGTVDGSVTPAYFATGGSVTVVEGATGLTGDGIVKVVIEYIETELASGEYTD
jgi:hypothetical protein